MKRLGKIFFYTDAESIMLYWNKPYATYKKLVYLVKDDAGHEVEVDKTHAILKNLEPEREYRIQVLVYGVRKNERKLLGNLMEKTIRTGRKKEDILVTDEKFGVVGDGETLNTAAIQKAIDSCQKNQRLVFPKGIFLTGALKLHSNMEIYLQKDAILRGTAEPEDYEPKIKSRFEGIEMACYSSLINIGELDSQAGYQCKNVILSGDGTIESGGRVLAEKVMEKERVRLRQYIQSLGEAVKEYENENTIPGRARPRLINISNAQNVRISGLTLKNGASWNVHMIYSNQVVTDHCTFYSEDVWNGDGWDPDSSSNCTIFACKFHTGDDAIAIKSGKNPEGNRINRPSRQIRIFDCESTGGHGITIGSEMSGGVRDVSVWDCNMEKSLYGLEIKATKKRGGYVKNIRVRDCVVPRVMIHTVAYNDDGEPAKSMPVFSDFVFSNLTITGCCMEKNGSLKPCRAIEMEGFDDAEHQISDVHFRGGTIHGDIFMRNCNRITFHNIQ